MYWLTKLAQKKTLVAIAMVFALSLAVGPVALGTTTPDMFGTKAFEDGKSGLGTSDVRQTIASVINVALSLLGVIAVVIILAGGFKWMTAAGNEDKTGEARKMIFAGVIGLAIILSSYAIAKFVLVQLSNATKTGSSADFYQNP